MPSNVDEYGFGQLDSWFIDTYLRHDGETLEDAKARVAADRATREATSLEKSRIVPKKANKE